MLWVTGEVQSGLTDVRKYPNSHVFASGSMPDQFDVLYASAILAFLSSFALNPS